MRPVFLPATLDELWELLDTWPGAGLYAGGTDLLPALRRGEVDPPALICLERIAELQGVREEGDEIWIGAATTFRRILEAKVVVAHLPVLAAAVHTIGSPLIRSLGTIGGNIITASPAGDTLPPLYVLGAVVELYSRNSTRKVPIGDFIPGPGATKRQNGEILGGVVVKKPAPGIYHHFEKVGLRRAMAVAVASLAALIRIAPDGTIGEARLAWGSVGPTVVRPASVEAILIGRKPSTALWSEAAAAARETVSPIDDLRASASYRRLVAGNLLVRLGAALPGPS